MSTDLDDFFRTTSEDGVWRFEAATVKWNGHAPHLEWQTFREWSAAPAYQQLADARYDATRDARFFQRCTKCKRITNIGHMFGPASGICQGCAERHLGVVY
jgi:hypothetical protein